MARAAAARGVRGAHEDALPGDCAVELAHARIELLGGRSTVGTTAPSLTIECPRGRERLCTRRCVRRRDGMGSDGAHASILSAPSRSTSSLPSGAHSSVVPTRATQFSRREPHAFLTRVHGTRSSSSARVDTVNTSHAVCTCIGAWCVLCARRACVGRGQMECAGAQGTAGPGSRQRVPRRRLRAPTASWAIALGEATTRATENAIAPSAVAETANCAGRQPGRLDWPTLGRIDGHANCPPGGRGVAAMRPTRHDVRPAGAVRPRRCAAHAGRADTATDLPAQPPPAPAI